MAELIGRLQSSAGVSELEVPIISADITWPLGLTPGTATAQVPAGFVRELGLANFKKFLSPSDPKAIVAGDDLHDIEFRHLYIDTADLSGIEAGNQIKGEVVTISFQDIRVWWHKRPSWGRREYNTEIFGERAEGFITLTPLPRIADNPRYHPSRIRTLRELINEAFDFMGIDPAWRKLTGGNGFYNITQLGIDVDQPELIVASGEQGASFIATVEKQYDMMFALSIDEEECGFIRRSDIPRHLSNVKQKIEALQQLDPNPVKQYSIGFDRERLPEVLQFLGGPLPIVDHAVLEPVIRDPDKPWRYLPLWRTSTLEALGVNVSSPALMNTVDNGEGVMRYVCHEMSKENPWVGLPPNTRKFAEEALTLWRIAQPLETSIPPGETAEIPRGQRVKTIQDATTGQVYTYVVSPTYRMKRDAMGVPGSLMQSVGGLRQIWMPGPGGTSTEPLRDLPMMPSIPLAKGGRRGGESDQVTGGDATYAKPRIKGLNVNRRIPILGAQGVNQDWVDFNFKANPSDYPNLTDFLDIGLEIEIVDPAEGVVKTPEPIFGNDGRPGGSASGPRAEATEEAGGTVGSRSRLVDDLDGVTIDNFGVLPELLFEREVLARGGAGEGEQVTTSPWGSPFLILQYCFLANAHGDERDNTTAVSATPSGRGGDPWDADTNTQDAFRIGLGAVPALPELTETATPAGARGHPLNVYQVHVPDIMLICESTRMTDGNFLSFRRDGEWRSGELTGTKTYMDGELVSRADGLMGSAPGQYMPASTEQYVTIMRHFKRGIQRVDEDLSVYRQATSAEETVNAEFGGWHREFFPGVDAFAENPVENGSVTINTNSSSATMRISANAQGYRPHLGSLAEMTEELLKAHRSAVGAVAGRRAGA